MRHRRLIGLQEGLHSARPHLVDAYHQVDFGEGILLQGLLHGNLPVLAGHDFGLEHFVYRKPRGGIESRRLLQAAVLEHPHGPGVPDEQGIREIIVLHGHVDCFPGRGGRRFPPIPLGRRLRFPVRRSGLSLSRLPGYISFRKAPRLSLRTPGAVFPVLSASGRQGLIPAAGGRPLSVGLSVPSGIPSGVPGGRRSRVRTLQGTVRGGIAGPAPRCRALPFHGASVRRIRILIPIVIPKLRLPQRLRIDLPSVHAGQIYQPHAQQHCQVGPFLQPFHIYSPSALLHESLRGRHGPSTLYCAVVLRRRHARALLRLVLSCADIRHRSPGDERTGPWTRILPLPAPRP